MNCFQLIRTVLDELYGDIPGTPEEKNELIKKRLATLSAEYMNLAAGVTIDYADPVTRFAYVYKYTTSHANMVYRKVMDNLDAFKPFLDNERVTLSCIGGGPGSDFLGMLKVLDHNENKPMLMCYLLDREVIWNESWSDIGCKIAAECQVHANFVPMNALDESSWGKHAKYLKADIFTMIYFLSEVYGSKDKAEKYFKHVFANARPGSLLLFVDNRDPMFYGWFDAMIADFGYEVLDSHEETFQMPWEEEKTDLGKYFKLFGEPKLKASIGYRVLRKG